MAKISFPTSEEMFKMGLGLSSYWEDGFEFPEGYKLELKKRFPKVRRLHQALDQADQAEVRDLLSAYLTKLSVITPELILKTAEEGKLEDLVDQARQAIEFKEFCEDLERRYFPERIRERERRREEALRSWGY